MTARTAVIVTRPMCFPALARQHSGVTVTQSVGQPYADALALRARAARDARSSPTNGGPGGTPDPAASALFESSRSHDDRRPAHRRRERERSRLVSADGGRARGQVRACSRFASRCAIETWAECSSRPTAPPASARFIRRLAATHRCLRGCRACAAATREAETRSPARTFCSSRSTHPTCQRQLRGPHTEPSMILILERHTRARARLLDAAHSDRCARARAREPPACPPPRWRPRLGRRRPHLEAPLIRGNHKHTPPTPVRAALSSIPNGGTTSLGRSWTGLKTRPDGRPAVCQHPRRFGAHRCRPATPRDPRSRLHQHLWPACHKRSDPGRSRAPSTTYP